MSELKSPKWVEVAIGLLRRNNAICLSLRQSHQHLANHWEFPGGKIEQDETPQQALTREFKEELGVKTLEWKPLIVVPWHYEKVSVRLHVFQTDQFEGEPRGLEGQLVEWCAIEDLADKHFPEANKGILQALNLPNIYMSIGSFKSQQACLTQFQQALLSGVRLAQFKSKGLEDRAFVTLANSLAELASAKGAKLMLNTTPDVLARVPNAAGIQLSSGQAQNYTERPISQDKLLAISVHTPQQIEHALKLEAELIVISPVKYTSAHPDMTPLGWQGLKEWIADIPVPVYGLGGMQLNDVDEAVKCGAQGIMVTKGVWPESEK